MVLYVQFSRIFIKVDVKKNVEGYTLCSFDPLNPFLKVKNTFKAGLTHSLFKKENSCVSVLPACVPGSNEADVYCRKIEC